MAEIFLWTFMGDWWLQFEKKLNSKKKFNGQRLTLQLVIIIRVRTGKLQNRKTTFKQQPRVFQAVTLQIVVLVTFTN